MTCKNVFATSLANASALLAVACMCMPATMHAGTIILEGSDAIGLHCPEGNAAACTYTAQVWTALEGPSALPIAVIGDATAGIYSAGPVMIDKFSRGPGRATRQRDPDGDEGGRGDHWHRLRHRPAGGLAVIETGDEPAVRNPARRPGFHRRRHGRAGGNRPAGRLHPRRPRFARRPIAGVALRVTGGIRLCLVHPSAARTSEQRPDLEIGHLATSELRSAGPSLRSDAQGGALCHQDTRPWERAPHSGTPTLPRPPWPAR